MRRHRSIGVALPLFLAVSAAPALAQDPVIVDPGPEEHLIHEADDIEWQDGPPSLPAGAQFAVLEGNPSEPGVFTLRLRMPDGYVIPPHWHPNVERFTVLSGTFLLGSGDTIDRDDVERLDAGSYTAMPPGTRHFGIIEGETVIQLTTVGPWQLNYVNPEDDPRTRD